MVSTLRIDHYSEQESFCLATADVIGSRVVTDDIPFSFNFAFEGGFGPGAKDLEVWIYWDPNNQILSDSSILKLYGDWEYFPYEEEVTDPYKLLIARKFFKKYKVIFAAVWEDKLQPHLVQRYLYGKMPLKKLITSIETQLRYRFKLHKINSLIELEELVYIYDLYPIRK